MNVKNIKAVLRRKFNEFVDSIEDTEVRELVRKGSIITGGAIVSLLRGEKVNDYDVYFKDYDTTFKVAQYYANRFNAEKGGERIKVKGFCINSDEEIKNAPERNELDDLLDDNDDRFFSELKPEAPAADTECQVKIWIQSDGIEGEESDDIDGSGVSKGKVAEALEVLDETPVPKEDGKPRYRPVFFTSNAISLSDDIQIVVRFYGSASEIHKNYDFVHCTCTWDSNTGELTLPNEALLAIMNKQLVYVGSKYPVASVIRMRKFLERGYTINAGQIFKICYQVSQLDLTDPVVLEDQLTGVDIGYFRALIDIVHGAVEAHKDTPEWSFSYNYISTIVDKIFG